MEDQPEGAWASLAPTQIHMLHTRVESKQPSMSILIGGDPGNKLAWCGLMGLGKASKHI